MIHYSLKIAGNFFSSPLGFNPFRARAPFSIGRSFVVFSLFYSSRRAKPSFFTCICTRFRLVPSFLFSSAHETRSARRFTDSYRGINVEWQLKVVPPPPHWCESRHCIHRSPVFVRQTEGCARGLARIVESRGNGRSRKQWAGITFQWPWATNSFRCDCNESFEQSHGSTRAEQGITCEYLISFS